MDYVSLGRTGLKVGRLALGTMNFGSYTDEAASFAIMDKSLERGINLFDTADLYPIAKGAPRGTTETIIGRWLAQNRDRRDRIVLATKVYGKMGSGPNDRRLSAYHIRKACEESLRRLQTDHIDLYQMHHVDRDTPWEEIWQAMETLVQQGKVVYVGSSNFAGWHLARAQTLAENRHFLGLVSEQPLYNLRNRESELEVLPACRGLGLGVLPWSPLAGGLLAGLKQKDAGGRSATEDVQREMSKDRSQVEAFEGFCRKRGEKPAQVALAWLLHNPVVTAPIIGPRVVEQVGDALRAVEIKLSGEDLEWLGKLWPGPGGEAPEAYAW